MKNGQWMLIALFGLLVLGGIAYLEVGFWNECRATNSWFYCFRLMGR